MKYFFGLFLLFGTGIYTMAQSFEVKRNGIALVYDQLAGTYSISKDKIILIKDAIAYARLADGTVISSDKLGAGRKISEQAVDDNLGKGKLYTVSSEMTGGLEMKQLFYFYDLKPMIIMQLEIAGRHISSNEMVPLLMKSKISALGNSLHQLSVPFDNDTFIAYENVSLADNNKVSAEIGIVYDRVSHQGLLIGSLDQSVWKSGIEIKGNAAGYHHVAIKTGFTDVNSTRDSMGHGYLVGDQLKSPKYLLSYGKDWRINAEDFAKIHRQLSPPYVHKWAGATPVGWNSWGVVKEQVNYQNATGTARYFAEDIPHFRNADGEAFIDLDSFWDNMTPGGMSGDYSQLKKFVAYCDSLGLKPGVYWAPFTDWGHGSGPDRAAEGSQFTFGQLWTKTEKGYHNLDGGRALDPTHPGTLARMDVILGKLVDCGFKMIKIDFLSHGAIESIGFYDPNIRTGMQAYAYGMKHLVDALKGQMLIYAAISPSLATNQFAHMRRIACDAWSTIDQTAYTLNSISYGWWQTHLYDYIDADHLVFHDQTEEVNKARFLSGIVGGTVILGDDFSKKQEWQPKMNSYLQNPEILAIIKDGKSFRPAGFVHGTAANDYYYKKSGQFLYIALFNFKTAANNLSIDLNAVGLKSTKRYEAVELYEQTKYNLSSDSSIAFHEAGAKLFRIKL